MTKGKFITFEGGEGTGKTTQIKLLADYLQRCKIDVFQTREPGGSLGAEKIRDLLVKGDPNQWDPLTEAVLFLAARRDHVEKMIKPALERGQWVLCDRFQLSTLVYSGYGHNIDQDKLNTLYNLIIGPFHPDKVIILSLDPQEGLQRAEKRGDPENRIEKKGLEYHQRVYQGYKEIARASPQTHILIEASDSITNLHKTITERLNPFLEDILESPSIEKLSIKDK
jgi:dTMP kinase